MVEIKHAVVGHLPLLSRELSQTDSLWLRTRSVASWSARLPGIREDLFVDLGFCVLQGR